MPTTTEIWTWIGVVFAAGFIGYFGRFLAMQILHRKKEKEKQKQAETKKRPMSKYEYKLEKKRLKSEQKKNK